MRVPLGLTGALDAAQPKLVQVTGSVATTSGIAADFFALMPPDNAATVAVGADVQFPQDGPNSSAGTISRTSASTFNLPHRDRDLPRLVSGAWDRERSVDPYPQR